MADKIPVRFLTGMSPYQAGEIAGFSLEQAAILVRAGWAEYLPQPAPPEPGAKAEEGPAADKMVRGKKVVTKSWP